MYLTYDPDVDAIYVTLAKTPCHSTKELGLGRLVDYAADGRPVGIELLGVRRGVRVGGLPEQERLADLLRANGIAVIDAPVAPPPTGEGRS